MSKKSTILLGIAMGALIATSAMAQEVITTDIDWTKGAPRFTSSNGQFQFKLRGRYLEDYYYVKGTAENAAGVKTQDNQSVQGFGTRAARLGVEGKLNEVFTFKAEMTLGSGSVSYNDFFLDYDNNGLEVIFGNNYMTSPLEALTSSTVQLTNERPFITQAFKQSDYNTGIVVRKYSDNWMVVGGLYGDKAENSETSLPTSGLTSVNSETRFLQVRGDYAINNEKGKYLVVGAHYRNRDGNGNKFTYNGFKPAQTNYAGSYLSSPSAIKDQTWGLEGFFERGPFSVMAEYSGTIAKTIVSNKYVDYKFDGASIEASYFLTGEVRGYDAKSGELKGVKPNSPLQEGGYGAWALIGRLDTIDLNDNGFNGGKATGYSLGVAWQPVDYVIFRTSYGHTDYTLPANGKAKADALTFRGQFMF